MKYTSQLKTMIANIQTDICNKIDAKGTESDHAADMVIKIEDEECQFLMEGNRYLTEVSKTNLIDNSGYQYSYFALNTDDFATLADYINDL